MKKIIGIGLWILGTFSTMGDGVTLPPPENDPFVQDSLNTPAQPDITDEEDADPPPGGFKKYHLRAIKTSRDIVVGMIGGLPQAEKDAPEFAKVAALQAALDKVLLTASKADLFALIDRSVELKRLPSTGPKFGPVCNALSILGGDVKRVVAKHIEDSNGVVPIAELETFVRLHSWSFEGESEWEAPAS